MTYKPTAADLAALPDSMPNSASSQRPYQPTAADLAALPDHVPGGAVGQYIKQAGIDVGGGLINPLINTANLVLPSKEAIPNIKTQPGIGSTLGGIAGYIAPFKGAEMGLDAAGAGVRAAIPAIRATLPQLLKGASAAIPEIESAVPSVIPTALKRGGKIIKSSLAGLLSGYGASPTGRRGAGAVFGGAGGAAGEGVGQLIGSFTHGAGGMGIAQALPKRFSESAPIPVNGEAGENMIEDIGKNYTDAKNAVSPLYRKTFNLARNQKMAIQPEDLTRYNAMLGKDAQLNRRIPSAIRTPDEFPQYELDNNSTALDPEQIHFERSRYSGLSHGARDPEQRIAYGRYADALNQDLNDQLKSAGLDDMYQNSANQFKEKLLPFNNNKVFRQQLKPALDMNSTVEDNGMHTLNIGGVSQTAPTTKIAKRLLPTANESDMGKLNELTQLMGGNAKAAGKHAKNVLFGDTVIRNPATGQPDLNVESFTNKAQKLSQPQRDFMFNPQEQQTLDALKKTQPARRPSRIRNLEQLGAGAAIGHHLLPGYGTVAGLLAGVPVGEMARRGMGSLLTRNKLMSELTRKALAPTTVKGTRVLAPSTAAFLMNLENNR